MPAPDDADRRRLIWSATNIIATTGSVALDPAEVSRIAGLPTDTLIECFGDVDELVVETARALCRAPVFTQPPRFSYARDVDSVLVALAAEHGDYVRERPERFRAIVQLIPDAVFGRTALLGPLAERNRRERRTVATHLWPLRTRGLIDPSSDIEAAAAIFVDVATGIETCFALDADATARDAAYAEACRLVTAILP